jgi:hypothetical protein
MKLTYLFSFLLFILFSVNAQAQFDPERFSEIKIKKKTATSLNKEAGEAAAYLLTTPAKPVRDDRLIATGFLIKWMDKHPNIDFTLGDFYAKATKNNGPLNPIFAACLAQVKLENLGTTLDEETIDLKTAEKLCAYAKDRKNKVYVNRYLKGMIKSHDKGELLDYIKQ